MSELRLSNPARLAGIIEQYNFRFQKKFGQNFLTDDHILEEILDAADVQKEDFVVEVGPGVGTLTERLCERAGHVLAVEIDTKLIPILQDTLRKWDNLTILNADILKTDIGAYATEIFPGAPIKVVANLPYYITTPIVMDLLESDLPFSSITIMIQKEVAERMQTSPGTKDYGALSLAVQYYTEPEYVTTVSRNCFMPHPNVDSAVICLHRREKPAVEVKDPAFLFRLIRASFSQRRKTLVNGIGNAPDLPVTKQQAMDALRSLGWNENLRGETLTLSEFAQLADKLMCNYIENKDCFPQ